jgi:AmmeMemoRadiSam system protein B
MTDGPFIRTMTHAGQWYPADAALTQMMKASFFHARVPPEARRNVVGILAPHGCYSVSLRTAAKSYSRVDPNSYDRAVVLGPSHHRPAEGCLVSTASALQTPFGDLAVDTDACRVLRESDSGVFIPMSRADDEAEHSLELQFPILKYVFQNRPIRVIPVVVGYLTEEQEASAVAVLSPMITADRTLFVISSDFTHWGEIFRWTKMANSRKPLSQQLKLHDDKALNVISTFNADHFRFLIEETNGSICGCFALCIILMILDKTRFTAQVVDRMELCELTSVKDFSISYVALVFSKKDAVHEEEDDEEKLFRQRMSITLLGRRVGPAQCRNKYLFNVVLVRSTRLRQTHMTEKDSIDRSILNVPGIAFVLG